MPHLIVRRFAPVLDALEIGRLIRGHAKHNGDTPLIVMTEKYGKDVEGTAANAGGNDRIFYLERFAYQFTA